MAADSTVIGLCSVKINGIYAADVLNARYTVRRANPVHVTTSGARSATGLPLPSGSFGEVIPRSKALNWFALRDFSIEYVDEETKSVVLGSFRGCNWANIDGSIDLAQALARRDIAWNGTTVVKA